MSKFGGLERPPTDCKTGRTNEMSRMRDMDNCQRIQNIHREHKKKALGMR